MNTQTGTDRDWLDVDVAPAIGPGETVAVTLSIQQQNLPSGGRDTARATLELVDNDCVQAGETRKTVVYSYWSISFCNRLLS